MNYFNPILKKRINAFTVDLAIIVSFNYFLMASFTNFLKIVFFHLNIQTQIYLLEKFTLINSVSLLGIMFAYFSIFYFTTNGKTMGKMIFDLHIKNATDTELSLKESMVRAFSYTLLSPMAFLLTLPLFTKNLKGLPDYFSNTEVVLTPKEATTVPQTEFQLTLIDCLNESNENEIVNDSEEDAKAA